MTTYTKSYIIRLHISIFNTNTASSNSRRAPFLSCPDCTVVNWTFHLSSSSSGYTHGTPSGAEIIINFCAVHRSNLRAPPVDNGSLPPPATVPGASLHHRGQLLVNDLGGATTSKRTFKTTDCGDADHIACCGHNVSLSRWTPSPYQSIYSLQRVWEVDGHIGDYC